jgi:Signal transduction histidine kinase
MQAVYSIGFGILAITLCIILFLAVVEKQQFFTSDVFVNIELVIVAGFICFVIALTFLIAFLTARKLRRKGQTILEATKRIKTHDLDFDIKSSGVKEIDQVLDGIDDMRQALKDALKSQWRLEQNRKDQISALVHDINTPITVLKGNMELLQSSSNINDASKEYIEDAKFSLKQIELYLNQLVEVTHADKGYAVNKQKINLGEMLDKTVSILIRIADEKEIAIITEKRKEGVFVSADLNLLERVLNNLISNALDFTQQKGDVKISLATDKSTAVICVSDSGCGFSQNALKYGKEQFFMEDASRGRKKHYGLGLYIADSIIKQHDGTLQLSNDELMGGAKVIIQIPLLKEL